MKMSRRQFGRWATGAVFAAALPGVMPSRRSAAAATTEPADALTIPARSPQLSYEGRTVDQEPGVVRLCYPGITLRLMVEGASRLTIKSRVWSDTCFVDISIDGGTWSKVLLEKGDRDLVIPLGAATNSVRTVEIVKCVESDMGLWDVMGVQIDGGRFRQPALPPHRKLMFVGDSITCGDSCEVPKREDLTAGPRTCNGRLSYGKVLAGLLDAQCHLVSYGGRGALRDWQGSEQTNNAPQFYPLAAPDDPSKKWDPAQYVPQAVGICLGTNDFNSGVPDQAKFVGAYLGLVQRIRQDAPAAHVIVMDSPMVIDTAEAPKRDKLCEFLDDVVKQANSPSIVRGRVPHYPGHITDGHPIAADQEDMARRLLPQFKAALEA